MPIHHGSCQTGLGYEACIDGPNGTCLYRFEPCESDGHMHWHVTLVDCGNCEPQG